MKIKKILKFVFIILIVIVMTNLVIIYKTKLTNSNDKDNNIEVSKENILEENKYKENEEENIIQTVIGENNLSDLETSVENSIVKEDNISNREEAAISKVEKVSSKVQGQNPVQVTNVQTTPNEITSAQTVSISKPIDINENNNQSSNIENNSSINMSVSTQVPTEEYKYNDSMTQNIVDIINSNPSQYMQQDGYTVIVDSSITSLTNQFTFSVDRVINKISCKAGTIKVYAQDYYYNGECLFTECYIF